jgi:hypothetical protein
MGKLPITSSLKRTAFQLRSVAKQTKKGKLGEIATGGGSGEGSTKTIEEDVMGKDTNYVHKGKKGMTDATRKGICDGSVKGDKSKVNCGDVVVDKKETVVKEDGVDFDVDYKQENKGRSLTFDQTREKKLNNTFVNKRLRKSKINEAKYKHKKNKDVVKYDTDGDGELSDEEQSKMSKGFLGFGNGRKRYAKNKAKYEENELERENYESLSANAQLDSASGVGQGENFQKADTDLTKGQQGLEAQLAEKKRLAEKVARDEARQNVAESEGVTTGQAGNAVGTGGGQATNAVDPGSSAGGMFDVGAFAPTDYSKILQGNSVAQKRGYGMKAKSVATKKLQGAQGKLPSHLQAAIKAAPGKRSVLKKSYFKNK